MNRIIHFELHAPDPEPALAFYKDVFGWKVTAWEGPEEYWLLQTGDPGKPGIDGGLMRSRDGLPRTVNTIRVQSVDECARKVTESGGEFVVPKMAIPGVGYLIYCKDPAGGLFGIMHEDPDAA